MAWHFIPNTLKVYLYIADYEAARRITGARRADEDYSRIADPVGQILARRRSEVLRFKKYYDVDIDALTNYELVIDTTFASTDEIVGKITGHVRSDAKPVCWIDPRNLVPTQGIGASAAGRLAALEKEMVSRGFDPEEKVVTLYVDHVFYIVDGHARVAAALRTGVAFVPAVIAAFNDQPYRGGLSARQYVRDAVHESLVHDWQDAIGFRFQDELWKGRAGATPDIDAQGRAAH
jgi:CMP/dCMP kinase